MGVKTISKGCTTSLDCISASSNNINLGVLMGRQVSCCQTDLCNVNGSSVSGLNFLLLSLSFLISGLVLSLWNSVTFLKWMNEQLKSICGFIFAGFFVVVVAHPQDLCRIERNKTFSYLCWFCVSESSFRNEWIWTTEINMSVNLCWCFFKFLFNLYGCHFICWRKAVGLVSLPKGKTEMCTNMFWHKNKMQ